MGKKEPVYSVCKVKSFTGMEGPGFNAELCCDGKAVAFAIDEGCGGEVMLQWQDWKETKVEAEITRYDKTKATIKCSPAEAACRDYCRGKLAYPGDDTLGDLELDPESLVSNLVFEAQRQARLRRQCRTKTLFRLRSDGPDNYRIVKKKYSAELEDWIRKRHGDDVIEIINTRFH